MQSKIGLDFGKVAQARDLARSIVAPVQSYIEKHTTVTVERATLRLLGADGADEYGTPVPNLIVDTLGEKISQGAVRYYVNALIQQGLGVDHLNEAIAKGMDISKLDMAEDELIQAKAEELIEYTKNRIDAHVQHRRHKIDLCKEKENNPLLYVIVATGNIYEDVKQAESAVEEGADVIAVIRTTAQSLLDYVPYGATTEGFGGTYATQENFRIMRAALDEAGDRQGRYVRLVNYASGLCMPEIAAMGALERLDMMLNDSMYGVLFRDINMYRTFVDQNFSRMLNSYADVVINTGEDNYLTTSDAFEKAYTVFASQFINEEFAFNAGMPSRLQGLGHAFEMDPRLKNGFLFELAQAQMAREIFPEAPLKYMPPTKFMTGDIFKGYAMNTLFNFVGKATQQGILLLGMLTEAIHTPYLQDRALALQNAQYVSNSMADFYQEIEFKKDGMIVKRCDEVLDQTLAFLEEIAQKSLFKSIDQGLFAEIKRREDGGKGLEGVYEKGPDYYNPFEEFLKQKLDVKGARK